MTNGKPTDIPPGREAFSALSLALVTPMANELESAKAFVEQVAAECGRFPFREVRHFVVLDRVSKDGTLELLRSLAAQMPTLSVVYAPENRSVVDAYLRGYRKPWRGMRIGFSRSTPASVTAPRISLSCFRRWQKATTACLAAAFAKVGEWRMRRRAAI